MINISADGSKYFVGQGLDPCRNTTSSMMEIFENTDVPHIISKAGMLFTLCGGGQATRPTVIEKHLRQPSSPSTLKQSLPTHFLLFFLSVYHENRFMAILFTNFRKKFPHCT